MIAPAKKCGCPVKTDFRTSPNFLNDFSCSKGTTVQEYFPPINSRTDSEKCICPRPNDPVYQRMKGNCDSCCEGVTGSKEDENEYINPEKRSKPLSEIVERGLPYKEIEAIINDNRMIIRVQKDSSTREEWDPPCDCNDENKKPPSQQKSNSHQNDVVFRKVDLNQCNQNPCRTITVYPHADSDTNQEPSSNKVQKEKEIDVKDINVLDSEKKNQPQQKPIASIDLEENPNIFLLRIKKRCENGDGKYNIDLEFRAPRPWLPKPIVKDLPPPVMEAEVENKHEEKKEKGKGKKGKKAK